MTINTVSSYQTAVGTWLNRSDLTTYIPDFIEMFQAKANREIRVPQMLTRDDLATVSSQYGSPPSDWLETVRYSLLTTPHEQLVYITPEEMDYMRESITDAGRPEFFSVVGGSFEFLPTPGDTYAASHLYYATLDLTTTNWLLTSHPDLCLYGALCEAEGYLMNDERVPLWQAKRDEAMQSLKKMGDRRAVPGTPRPRIRSF